MGAILVLDSVSPDILTLAITNGVQPLGAVVSKQEIYDTYMNQGGLDYMVEFPHGYTYSAHPVACVAGLAALEVLEREQLPQRVKAMSDYFEQAGIS